MKKTKRLASLLLALVMVFALAVPALAADHIYEVYQIFTGDVSEGTLSNIKWGTNGTGTTGAAVEESVITALAAVSGKPDTEKLEVITTYVSLTGDPYKTGSANQTTFTGLPAGYYLVKDKDNTQDGEDGYYTLYVVEVVDGTLTITPKGGVPEVDKKIVEGENKVGAGEASIGDTISYEFTGTLPSNFDAYNTYYYAFTDTLSKGLTYADSLTVTIKNGNSEVDVTKYFYVGTETDDETGKTTLTVAIQDLKALNNVTGVTVDKESKVVVTYSAKLNENAVIGSGGNKNDVKLDYYNNPNESGEGTDNPPPDGPDKPKPEHPTGETPKETVETYTTGLTIKKTDGNGNILPGAEFTLKGEGVKIVLVTQETFTEDENGAYWRLKNGTYTKTAPTTTNDEANNSADYESTTTKYSKTTEVVAKGDGTTATTVVGVVDSETGEVTFSGLGAGEYTITETKTPEGYNTIDPITFTLTFDPDTKKFTSNNEDIAVGEANTLNTTIVNKAGSELPSTGGMGTTVFYVAGSILVLAAVVLLVTKKRMSGEKK